MHLSDLRGMRRDLAVRGREPKARTDFGGSAPWRASASSTSPTRRHFPVAHRPISARSVRSRRGGDLHSRRGGSPIRPNWDQGEARLSCYAPAKSLMACCWLWTSDVPCLCVGSHGRKRRRSSELMCGPHGSMSWPQRQPNYLVWTGPDPPSWPPDRLGSFDPRKEIKYHVHGRRIRRSSAPRRFAWSEARASRSPRSPLTWASQTRRFATGAGAKALRSRSERSVNSQPFALEVGRLSSRAKEAPLSAPLNQPVWLCGGDGH